MEFRIISKLIDTFSKSPPIRQQICSLLGSRHYSSGQNEIYDDFDLDERPHHRNPRSGQFNRNSGNPQRDSYQEYDQRDPYQRSSNQRGSYRGYGQRDSYGYGQRNSYQGHEQRFGNQYGRSSGRGFNFMDIPQINWNEMVVEPFKKNLYIEPDIISNRSSEEIAEFRTKNEISIRGDKANKSKPILNFSDYQFPLDLQPSLDALGFEKPMPIQSETWPLVMSGCDVIGVGQTGSGKTLGFVLPAIVHALCQENTEGPNILVLAPTRELIQQIRDVFKTIGNRIHFNVACLYGGASKYGQYEELQRKPKVILATPGRLMDLMVERACNLKSCTMLVLDEADRMLDMGFEPQLRGILKQIRPDRQTVMWSATWPRSIQNLAKQFTNNAIQINIGSSDLSANPDIVQEFSCSHGMERMNQIGQAIEEEMAKRNKVLIFSETQRDVSSLSRELNEVGFHSEELHGGHSQSRRDRVINGFKQGRVQVCVATDVASRGLDVEDIGLVINYEAPKTIESYIHRIGRTGRAGKKGKALTFFTNPDPLLCKDISTLIRKSGQEVPQTLADMTTRRRRY